VEDEARGKREAKKTRENGEVNAVVVKRQVAWQSWISVDEDDGKEDEEVALVGWEAGYALSLYVCVVRRREEQMRNVSLCFQCRPSHSNYVLKPLAI
jgi:hypothetical protein